MTTRRWLGRTVVIAASGPSQNAADLALCRGRAALVAINNTWQLCPWADALYAADPDWWKSSQAPGRGAFAGRQMTQSKNWTGGEAQALGLEVWPLEEAPGLSLQPPVIRKGIGSSAFQAANVAVHEGAARILLTGCDCTGSHWHGRHGDGLNNPTPDRQEAWRTGWGAALPEFAAAGVEIVNCTRGGVLDTLPRLDLATALGAVPMHEPVPTMEDASG